MKLEVINEEYPVWEVTDFNLPEVELKWPEENTEVSKCDIVKLCGYTSVRKNGSIKLNYTQFYQALLSAQEVF